MLDDRPSRFLEFADPQKSWTDVEDFVVIYWFFVYIADETLYNVNGLNIFKY